MKEVLNELLTNKYLKSENILKTINEDFLVLKERTKNNNIQGSYVSKPEQFLFDKLLSFIQKDEILLYFSSFNGDTFVSNQYIDPYILSSFEELYLKRQKTHSFFVSKVKSIHLTLDEYKLHDVIKGKIDQYGHSLFGYENNFITLYCTKLNYARNRKFLIEKTIQKRIFDCLSNQCSNKPFLTESLKIKIFNKIISVIIKDILFPASNLEKRVLEQNNFSLLKKRISTKKILSLILDKNEIISSYVVPIFFSYVKFRKEDFDEFLVFFDKYLTSRILSEIPSFKEEYKTAFSLKSIEYLIVKYGLCKISFYDKKIPKEFMKMLLEDIEKIDEELKVFFKTEKRELRENLLHIEDVPF